MSESSGLASLLDALVAAFDARAAKIGLPVCPTEDKALWATTEGWIHVPVEGSLDLLDLCWEPITKLKAEGVREALRYGESPTAELHTDVPPDSKPSAKITSAPAS